jgi:hypothetical protein
MQLIYINIKKPTVFPPDKKVPADFSPNIGMFFVFFSGNFMKFQEISEIFQKTSWKNSSRY